MQRRQRHKAGDCPDEVVVDQRRNGEVVAPVHDTVADGHHVGVAERGPYPFEGIVHCLQGQFNVGNAPSSMCRRPSAVACRRRPAASPICSTSPPAGVSPLSGSTSRYFNDEEPAFTTRMRAVTSGLP